MARKGMEVTTTVSFQVTFKLPKGMNIIKAREHIKDALSNNGEYGGELKLNFLDIKCHLTNKEVQYGQR